ncbi:MAG TPA: type II secretion system F family protein [Gammaproteobacteria bacterium]|nr:type II secretion system F family protein [Gammaproteobacteria bacterium]
MPKSATSGKYNFSYTARDLRNRKVKGEILAESITVAQSELRKQGLLNIKLQLMREPSFIVKFFSRSKIKSRDITIFTRQLATLQTAGIPLVNGLKVIIESSEKPAVAKLIARLKNELESGGSLSECLRLHPNEFDELFCNLVAAGESSGNVDVMLQRIAMYREKTESIKRKIIKAMYYPIAVLSVATIVTAILLIKVVPTFKSMFEGFGSHLPAFTMFVLNLSNNVQHNGLKFLVTFGVLIWIFNRLYRSQATFRNAIQRMTLRLPIFGKILQKAAVARFARTLSTTFAAGVPLPDALLLVARSSGNIKYYNAIMEIRDGVSMGKRINTSMQQTKVFPHMVIQMVAIGEETGTLNAMLQKVANIYEEEVDLAVDGMSTLMEPIIMIVLGVIVGGLVIAMYLPIFKLGSVI